MKTYKNFPLLVLVATLGLGASKCAHPVSVQDTSAMAAEANDATVIIEGCGNQPVVGYTYCRVPEGSDAKTKNITLIAPPSECSDKDSCVDFKVYYPDGSQPALGVTVPKGQTRVTLPWNKLLGRDTFEKADRGFWPVIMTVKWIAPDGQQKKTLVEGEIRLRVTSQGYEALQEVEESQNYAWHWNDKLSKYRMSTSGRAYAGRIQ